MIVNISTYSHNLVPIDFSRLFHINLSCICFILTKLGFLIWPGYSSSSPNSILMQRSSPMPRIFSSPKLGINGFKAQLNCQLLQKVSPDSLSSNHQNDFVFTLYICDIYLNFPWGQRLFLIVSLVPSSVLGT